jgi:hypothetical protein
MVRYDEHALFQLERRIARDVEETVRSPDEIETKGIRLSYLKCLPGRRFMLRVVTPAHEPGYVITAYFDRRKPCA